MGNFIWVRVVEIELILEVITSNVVYRRKEETEMKINLQHILSSTKLITSSKPGTKLIQVNQIWVNLTKLISQDMKKVNMLYFQIRPTVSFQELRVQLLVTRIVMPALKIHQALKRTSWPIALQQSYSIKRGCHWHMLSPTNADNLMRLIHPSYMGKITIHVIKF